MDPVQDEMLANFVVDSHFKSHPKHQDSDDQQSRPVITDPEVSYVVMNPPGSFCVFLSLDILYKRGL